jgi:hypothetical protein
LFHLGRQTQLTGLAQGFGPRFAMGQLQRRVERLPGERVPNRDAVPGDSLVMVSSPVTAAA